MSLVDYERGFLDLRARLLEKPSWGQRELLGLLTEIEVDNRVPEGERGYEDGPPPARRRPSTRSPREVARNGS